MGLYELCILQHNPHNLLVITTLKFICFYVIITCHKEKKVGKEYYAMYSSIQEITFNKVMASSTTF
jgi:hypothetical protein